MMLRRRLDPEQAAMDDDFNNYADNTKDRKAVLAIAYHNMGVE